MNEGRHASPEELGMAQEDMVTVVDPENDELEILVVSDDIKPEDQRPPASTDYISEDLPEEELAELGGRAQKRIKKLTWEKNEERRNKEAAERIGNEAVEHGKRLTADNERLRGALQKTQVALNEQASKRADGALRAAEEAFKVAHAEGDAEKIAEAQKAMTASLMAKSYAPSVAKRVMEDFVNEHDAAIKAKAGPDGVEKQVTIPTEPPPPDPQTQAWYDRNPWFGVGPEKDRVMTGAAYGIHENLILVEHVIPETPEYYQRLDEEIRKLFPSKFEAPTGNVTQQQGTVVEVAPTASQTPPNRVDTIVAPGVRNNGAKSPQKITLTESQVSVAKRLGVSIEDYARSVVKQMKEQANV